jgi:hypothetical protein
MEDHTGSGDPGGFGVDTPELQTADNDYAVGIIVEAVSPSAVYKNNTLIFIFEDDAQDGPDHVDAHRSVEFVAGANVKRGAVISLKYTTVSFKFSQICFQFRSEADHLLCNDGNSFQALHAQLTFLTFFNKQGNLLIV